jgi:hypothetical protein
MPEREVGQAVVKSTATRQSFVVPQIPQISFPLQPSKREFSVGFYSTLALSSSCILHNSTRHSVTSRIERNSRPLSDLNFSTRHLNATPENTPTWLKIQHPPSPFQRFRLVSRYGTAYETPLRIHCCVTKTRAREPRPGSREPLRFLCYPPAFGADETLTRSCTYHCERFNREL